MIGNLLKPELKELIEHRRFNQLRELLSAFSAADIADIFLDTESADCAVMLRVLPKTLAADVFEYLEIDQQEEVLRALGQEHVAEILNEMEPDDRTAILEELPPVATNRLINLLSPEERKIAVTLLGYPEGSIARRMTPEYAMVKEEWTVAEVLEHLRKFGQKLESFNLLFVVQKGRLLVGTIRLRSVLLASEDTPVRELFETQIITLHPTDPQEKAVEVFKKYDRTMLPVVDTENRIVGVITVDDVLDIMEEEATEDMHKMGGMQALEGTYTGTSFFKMVKKRIGWLAILFVGEMLTATAMGYFETEIAQAVVLALFVPLVISSGGNSGSQAASIIIRALALGDVKLRDWWRVMHREVFTGLVLGTALGLIGFFRVVIWANVFGVYGEHWFLLALSIGLALIGVVLWGSLAGSMLPFIMKRLGTDPATSSAPFVATLVDVTGLIIYFTVARLILTGTLL